MKNFFKISLCLTILIISVFSFTACDTPAEPQLSGPAYEDPRFYEFETGLIGKKLEYEKIIKRDHTLVGANEGWAYIFDNNFVVELYAFDENSEVYKTGSQTNYIPMITQPVKFNGTLCIYVSDYNHAYVDDIFTIFRNIKVN